MSTNGGSLESDQTPLGPQAQKILQSDPSDPSPCTINTNCSDGTESSATAVPTVESAQTQKQMDISERTSQLALNQTAQLTDL